MPEFPTPYPEVNTVLERLHRDVKAILGEQFVGMYLQGSLALGDFRPDASDIDFVVVTAGDLPRTLVSRLAALHRALGYAFPKWGPEIEGSYVPRRKLWRYDPADATFPHIEQRGELVVEEHATDWLINCTVLREKGIMLSGPEPASLIAPITTEALRRAVLDLLWWWDLQLEDTHRVEQAHYQAYAVLTMCRMLYTMQHGEVVSKPAAVRWARESLEARWQPLIDCAFAWPAREMDHLDEALAFIRYTLSACRADEVG